MALYVFAIGGSGSRVLRSLTMMLASGVQCKSDIVPIIIDPDASNGDMVRTVELLRDYSELRSHLSFDNNTQNRFFSTKIQSLNDDDEFLLQLIGTSGITFDKYMKVSKMSDANQAMVNMLFSNKNLSSTMDVGFKGNPNIGSIVLNQISESPVYQNFLNDFSTNDKVFIISSIFGGTGASGFPLLLKSLRSSTNTALKDAPIGAVTLLPYFNLAVNEDSSIQADSFITKAKAALNYYEKNVTGNGSLDEMYYLGDDFSNVSYDNCDGGDNQQNNAHIVEMLAALSIIDFDNKTIETSGKRQTGFHEFGLETEPESGKSVVFADFGENTRKILLQPLSMMAVMGSYFRKRDKQHIYSQKWAKDKNEKLGSGFFGSPFYAKFDRMMKNHQIWLDELKDNNLSFSPFNTDEDVAEDELTKIIGYQPSYGIFSKKGFDLLDETLSKQISSIGANVNPESSFFELFTISLGKIFKERLKIEN